MPRWPKQRSRPPAQGRRLSCAKPRAFRRALAQSLGQPPAPPTRRNGVGAQRAAPARGSRRGWCSGGRGSATGAAGAARWPPAPRHPNWRQGSWQRGWVGPARSGRLLLPPVPPPRRNGAAEPSEARGRGGARRGGLIANGSSYVDGGREPPAGGVGWRETKARLRGAGVSGSQLLAGLFCCCFLTGVPAFPAAPRPVDPLVTARARTANRRWLPAGRVNQRPLGSPSRPPPAEESSAGPRPGTTVLPPLPAGAPLRGPRQCSPVPAPSGGMKACV